MDEEEAGEGLEEGCEEGGAHEAEENVRKIKNDDSLRPSREFADGGVYGRGVEGGEECGEGAGEDDRP